MKKRLIFLLVLALSVFINTVPLIIFREKAGFSVYSPYSCIFMTVISTVALIAYDLRHKGNLLLEGRRMRFYVSDRAITFSEEYSRTFFWQFTHYCAMIPLFIPCIFFTKKPIHLIWTLLVAALTILLEIAYGIADTMKDVKEDKIVKQRLKRELEEQKKREELGRFK